MTIYKDAIYRKITIEENREITILQWIQQQIDYSDDGIIRMRFSDIKNVIGKKFEDKSDIDIFNGLKRVLSENGIMVRLRSHVEDESVILTMEYKQYENDKIKIADKKNSDKGNIIVHKDTIWVGKFKDKTGTFEILVPANKKEQTIDKIRKSLKDIKEEKKGIIGKIEEEELMYIEEVGDFDYIRV